jgi:hypothetical protein
MSTRATFEYNSFHVMLCTNAALGLLRLGYFLLPLTAWALHSCVQRHSVADF